MMAWRHARTYTCCLLLWATGMMAQEAEPFWLGTDMGWLTEMEARGWKCHDVPADAKLFYQQK